MTESYTIKMDLWDNEARCVTDDFAYNVVKDPVHVHDFQATLLHLLGIEHTKLTFKFQGRYYRLTDVFGKLVPGIVA